MSKYVISLDQGTTSSRAIIFDKKSNIITTAQKEHRQIYPMPGYVEHDPMEIYASQYGVLSEVLARTGIAAEEISAIGITNQRETTVVWEKESGNPVYNAIVWQCRRTAGICEELKEKGYEEYISSATGLKIDAYFSATKVRWILDNIPNGQSRAENGELLFGTVDTWLIWKLTSGKTHATDYTNASRTMLFNINTLKWDEKILDALSIPKCMLPIVKNSSDDYGSINILGKDVKICGVAGDQQAALFGQACFEAGDAKNTYGTGCFLLMNTGDKPHKSNNGLITTIAYAMDGEIKYALEGSIFVGGAVVQWLRDELRFLGEASDSEYFAQKVSDNGGVYVVPAFTGLGAPYWDMYARGCILGITRGAGRDHIIRASLESIAYQTKDVIDAMIADTGIKIKSLKVDGGASANNFLMQFQADILRAEVIKPTVLETTALGAAYLAGLFSKLWKSKEEIIDITHMNKVFSPNMPEDLAKGYVKSWHRAVKRSAKWENDEDDFNSN